MTIGERIKKKREELKLSQEQLAEIMGYKSKTSIHKAEQGITDLPQSKIIEFARALKTTPSYLMGWEEKTEKSNIVILDKSQFIYVPVYGKASAGNGYINIETVLYDKLIHINGYSHDSFLIEVSGDSMEPTILDGEYVLVDPTSIEICEGKIYVITYNGETFIKMIEKYEEDEIVLLKSINQKYRDKVIKKEEFENVKIEGRVVKVISERNL
ncbi:XRE family transcriptional regulator [Fusobacterium sp. THCT1E2]